MGDFRVWSFGCRRTQDVACLNQFAILDVGFETQNVRGPQSVVRRLLRLTTHHGWWRVLIWLICERFVEANLANVGLNHEVAMVIDMQERAALGLHRAVALRPYNSGFGFRIP